MDIERFKQLAQTNEWLSIWPEITLVILALFVLLIDLFAPKRGGRFCYLLVSLGQVALVVCLLFSMRMVPASFGDLLTFRFQGQLMRVFFLISSLYTCFLARVYFSKKNLLRSEYYHLVLLITAALMILVQSQHFILFFVSLEVAAIGFCVLVSYDSRDHFSLEAGLKYLILGAMSTAILLFGVALLYGVAGSPDLSFHASDPLSFTQLKCFIAAHPDLLWVRLGAILILAGIAFKIGVFPFQIWIPDVYQGAPTPTTAFLAVASKAAGFIVLLNLVMGPFRPLLDLIPLLSVVAAVTILFGNAAALSQENVKRLMGLSGIAHAGILLLGVLSAMRGVPWAETAVIFYLFVYLIGSFAVFGVMQHIGSTEEERWHWSNYKGLGKSSPFLSGVLTMGLGSLAGIPPFVGFFAKVFIFIAAYQAKLYFLLGVALLGVVLSIYYYFRWMREALFGAGGGGTVAVSLYSRIVLGAIAAATVLLGLYQGFWKWLG